MPILTKQLSYPGETLSWILYFFSANDDGLIVLHNLDAGIRFKNLHNFFCLNYNLVNCFALKPLMLNSNVNTFFEVGVAQRNVNLMNHVKRIPMNMKKDEK